MPYYTFDVKVHYRTDPIYADNEEEARKIAYDELDYCGEEYDYSAGLMYEEDE